LSHVRCSSAPGSGLGLRAPFDYGAALVHRWSNRGRWVPAARRRQKRADYLLRYTRDVPIAVVEAKADYQAPGQGLGQAKDYAEVLGLKFAYSTNGEGIVEFDFLTGSEKNLHAFPTPDELWQRLKATQGTSDEQEAKVLTPGFHAPGRTLRYYQEVAVNRTVQAIVQGKRRLLRRWQRVLEDRDSFPDLLAALECTVEP